MTSVKDFILAVLLISAAIGNFILFIDKFFDSFYSNHWPYNMLIPTAYKILSNKRYRLVPRMVIGLIVQVVTLPGYLLSVFSFVCCFVAIIVSNFVKWILVK